jgi:flagellar basal body L-ring protein FlgH
MNFKFILLALCAFQLTACSGLMGGLRKDLDDGQTDNQGPTVGGAWSERGFLSEDPPESGGMGRYNSVGHSDRSPASNPQSQDPNAPQAWNQAGSENEQRDGYRELGTDQDSPTGYSDAQNVPPPSRRMYKNGNRATQADFRDESPNEGSLWATDGQTNYYFTKNKVRSPGDIISIDMEQDMIRDIGSDIKRTLTPREKETELALAQDRLRKQAMGGDGASKDSVATSAAAPNRAPAAAGGDSAASPFVDVPEATPADVDVSKSLEIKAGDMMMAEIVERYPNGNYKIRGVKRIPYKNGAPRMVSVVGVARGTDISEDDVVKSGKLYEYQIQTLR